MEEGRQLDIEVLYVLFGIVMVLCGFFMYLQVVKRRRRKLIKAVEATNDNGRWARRRDRRSQRMSPAARLSARARKIGRDLLALAANVAGRSLDGRALRVLAERC